MIPVTVVAAFLERRWTCLLRNACVGRLASAIVTRVSAAEPSQPPSDAELWAQLVALPETQKGEIIDGELHVQPRPPFRHARAGLFLGRHIGGAFDCGFEGAKDERNCLLQGAPARGTRNPCPARPRARRDAAREHGLTTLREVSQTGRG